MKLREGFSLAIKNIISSKMRALLTMLGVIIGILAVIIIVGLGNGLTKYVEDSFADMGTDILTVNVMGRGSSTRTVSDDDMYEIIDENQEYFEMMSPTVSVSSAAKIGTTELESTITGVSEDYFDIKKYEVSEGRNITFADIENRSDVIVVGEYINSEYFNGNAIGEEIRINGLPFEVVGVMAAESDTPEEGGTDDAIYMPYSTASRSLGTGVISSYSVLMVDENLATESKTVLEDALYEHFESDNSYMVMSIGEMLDTMTSMISILVYVLAGIAAISLLVGGIGIMNIMLVSVTERTREIGIRKSLGARQTYIMQQFVIESACISAIGGLIGIGLGYLFASLASTIASSLMGTPFTVDPGIEASLLAFSISVGIGILFGYLPAKRAAALNPIDALRF